MTVTVDGPRTAVRWDYAPAPESPDAARIAPSYDLFIGGEFVDPGDGFREPPLKPATQEPPARGAGSRAPTLNPAPEEPLAEVAFAGTADVARAVEAARAAASGWRGLPAL